MVNPNKHAKNLNEDDLEYIYERLNKSYNEAEENSIKKEINQQIIVFLLTCLRFSPQDLIRVPYIYFNHIKKDDLLYEPINRHIKNNYCKTDGLLLTDSEDNAYTINDINLLLSRIDTGKIQKEISIETLNKTKSRFNAYGKKSFNKQELKEHLNKIETNDKSRSISKKSYIKDSHDINKINSDSTEESKEDLTDSDDFDKLSDKLSEMIVDKIQSEQNQEISQLEKQLNEIIEKQDILEDSFLNKHNQLSNTVNKIHQNIKASNNKFTQLDNKFKQLPIIEDKINNMLSNQNDSFDEIYSKLENIHQSVEENTTSYEYHNDEVDNSASNIVVSTKTTKTNNINYLEDAESNKLSLNEQKEFMFKWFTKNMKITRSPHDTVDINEITLKVDKYIESKNVAIDKDALYNRLESYLKYWYNSYNKSIDFKDIKTKSISGKQFYSYLKFIDIKQERENRIKNSIITWLKEHTVEVEGSKTYTHDIFLKLQPIFEENGWIITDKNEWKELHDAGYTKVCPSRTFSQIIGKSVQEVYESINKSTIQRDSPTETGFVTWYPNIQIIDKKLSDDVHLIMKNELSDEIFESDNIIYNWLKDNITYTGNDEDRISYNSLLDNIRKYLLVQEINISEDNLETIFDNIFISFLNHYSIEYQYPLDEITQVTFNGDITDRITPIISKWLETHLVSTDNRDDKVYLEDINDKLSSLLFSEGLTIVPDNLYIDIQSDIRENFIRKSQYDEVVVKLLDSVLTVNKVEDSLGIYYESLEMVKYNLLTDELLEDWIKENISIINQRLIMDQENLLEKFEVYMADNNIRNYGDDSTMELLDKHIKQYYMDNSCGAIQILQDENSRKFYVGIALE